MGFPPPHMRHSGGFGGPSNPPPSLSKEGCRGGPPYKRWGGVLQTPPPNPTRAVGVDCGVPPPIGVTVGDLGVPPIPPPQSLSKEGCRGGPFHDPPQSLSIAGCRGGGPPNKGGGTPFYPSIFIQ